jgi:hypothetical protein
LVTRRVPYERFQVCGYPPLLSFLGAMSVLFSLKTELTPIVPELTPIVPPIVSFSSLSGHCFITIGQGS